MHFWLPMLSEATVALGLWFTLRLWQKKENWQVNRWLAALMLALTLINVEAIFAYSPMSLAVPELTCCLDWVMFLAGPIGYQYVRALTGNRVFSRRAWLLHGFPAVVSVVVLIFGFYLKPHSEKLRIAQENLTYDGGPDLLDKLGFAAAMQIMIYLAASVLVVRRYRKRLKALVARPYVDVLRLSWLTTLFVVFFILVFFEAFANAKPSKAFDFMAYLTPSIGLGVLVRISYLRPQVLISNVVVPDDPRPGSSRGTNSSAGFSIATTEYPSCFMSYSTNDQEFTDKLYKDLMARDVRCWFAPKNLKIGDKFRDSIHEAIHKYDKFLLVISEHSLQSKWVDFEVEVALSRESMKGIVVVFPIKLDASIEKARQKWARYLHQHRHIGDFRNWRDPAAYTIAFERLCRDLKSGLDQSASSA